MLTYNILSVDRDLATNKRMYRLIAWRGMSTTRPRYVSYVFNVYYTDVARVSYRWASCQFVIQLRTPAQIMHSGVRARILAEGARATPPA